VRARTSDAALGAAPEGKASWWANLRAYLGTLWEGGPFDLLLWALLVGSLGFLNTWDYPIYLGLLVLAYAIRRHADVGRLSWAWVYDVVQVGLLLLVVGVALYFPFYLSFRSQAGGIGLVGIFKTRLHQYLLMFGTQLFLVLGLLGALAARYARRPAAARKLPLAALVVGAAGLAGAAFALAQSWGTAALGLALLGLSGALLLWGARVRPGGDHPHAPLEPSLLFALLLVLAGLALTVSVEFIFLRDTFGTRMNTVFKFYYQGWVLLALAGACGAYYVVEQLWEEGKLARVGLAAWSLVALALLGAGLSYTIAATVSKAEGFRGEPALDGTRYVERYRKDDYDAIQWLRAHAREGAVMVEATGGSYSEYNWVSAHTGIPTLLGWGGHELQWRGNYDIAGKREQDIPAIYQSTDATKALQVLDKYNVDYVYIGRLEREKYRLNQAMINKFAKIMDKVYDQGNVIIYARAR
jgi:YYY domain-containing protein